MENQIESKTEYVEESGVLYDVTTTKTPIIAQPKPEDIERILYQIDGEISSKENEKNEINRAISALESKRQALLNRNN